MTIRNKSIISIFNNGEVLLTEGYDPIRDFRFFSPVGGGIEFGETSQAAAERELQEELQLQAQTLTFLGFHESVFSFLGKQHHEILFHFICHISDQTRQELPPYVTESNGNTVNYSWYNKSRLKQIETNVVPLGIYSELVNAL